MRRLIAVVMVCGAALLAATPASAEYGDNFGIAPAEGSAFPTASAFWAGACDLASPATAAGTAPATRANCLDLGTPNTTAGTSIFATPPAWRLADATAAGSHPDATAAFWLAREPEAPGVGAPEGAIRTAEVELPAGFIGDPQAVPFCPAEALRLVPLRCPPQSQVGVATYELNSLGHYSRTVPLYNVEPRRGVAAEFMFEGSGLTNLSVTASVRTAGDFGVTTLAERLPVGFPIFSSQVTLWGVPWAASHDLWRAPAGGVPAEEGCSFGSPFCGIPRAGYSGANRQHYNPSWGPIRPLTSNPTRCVHQLGQTVLAIDSWEQPGVFHSYEASVPPITECDKPAFDPSLEAAPTTQAADSPSGLGVSIKVPQNDEPPASVAENPDDETGAPAYWKTGAGRATSDLKDSVVTLPEGMSLNPAAANGLEACTTQQIGLLGTEFPMPTPIRFDDSEPTCPDASKVGTVTIKTPLLEEEDWPSGVVYLAAQGDNPFHSDYAIYVVAKSPERNLIIKLAGKVEPDPVSGQLKATFSNNPQLPFDEFELHFKGGARAPLATPATCGSFASTATLTPWTADQEAGGSAATVQSPFAVTSSPAGGCPADPAQRPLSPGFEAGSTNPIAGSYSPFTVRITRPDGNQELDRIDIVTPPGFAARLAGVPYCPEPSIAQAAARTARGDGALEQSNPSCPAASQVGTTTIGAGAGPSPFYVSGKVYLAGPYKGAPLSLAFVVPAVAGPFDLGVQVVRVALRVNPETAQITAASDPIPQILGGVPLRIRDIRVAIDRGDFALNPTNCEAMAVSGTAVGASGASASLANRFQVDGCQALPFKPKLTLRVLGKTNRSAKPRLKAVLTTQPGEANISRAQVNLPRSLFLEQNHIRTICTRVQWEEGNGNGSACPPDSIYGYAKAWTPLLEQPLQGPVYLRANGGVRKLPDVVAALGGQIDIALWGKVDSGKNAGLRNTFEVVPDAPVSRFVLEMKGGSKGLLVNSEDLCSPKAQRKAIVRFLGQNGKVRAFKPTVANHCKKGKRRG